MSLGSEFDAVTLYRFFPSTPQSSTGANSCVMTTVCVCCCCCLVVRATSLEPYLRNRTCPLWERLPQLHRSRVALLQCCLASSLAFPSWIYLWIFLNSKTQKTTQNFGFFLEKEKRHFFCSHTPIYTLCTKCLLYHIHESFWCNSETQKQHKIFGFFEKEKRHFFWHSSSSKLTHTAQSAHYISFSKSDYALSRKMFCIIIIIIIFHTNLVDVAALYI